MCGVKAKFCARQEGCGQGQAHVYGQGKVKLCGQGNNSGQGNNTGQGKQCVWTRQQQCVWAWQEQQELWPRSMCKQQAAGGGGGNGEHGHRGSHPNTSGNAQSMRVRQTSRPRSHPALVGSGVAAFAQDHPAGNSIILQKHPVMHRDRH
eukprot:959916-Pelagomonas_calceolata.AAC.1